MNQWPRAAVGHRTAVGWTEVGSAAYRTRPAKVRHLETTDRLVEPLHLPYPGPRGVKVTPGSRPETSNAMLRSGHRGIPDRRDEVGTKTTPFKLYLWLLDKASG